MRTDGVADFDEVATVYLVLEEFSSVRRFRQTWRDRPTWRDWIARLRDTDLRGG